MNNDISGKKKVAIVSLGCDKNRVDTENLMYLLAKGGYSFTDDMAEADAYYVDRLVKFHS